MNDAFATGGFHGLSYVKESVFGTTPANPQMKLMRHTSCSLVLSKESLQSAELRSDSQISDLRHGNRQAGGAIGYELSFGDFDDFLAAAVRSEWEDDVDGRKILKAGLIRHSFTFERAFTDIGQYQQFQGCQINTMSFSIQTNAMITGQIGVLGMGVGFTQAALDPTPDTARGGSPLDGFSGSLEEGGSAIGTVTGIELNIDNGMNPAFVLGSPVAAAILPGRINISGTISAYFQNMDLLRKFVDETESSIKVTLGNGTDSSYLVTLPRIKYSGGDNAVDGEGAVVLNMPFQALYDDCTGTNILIERIPPVAIPPCVLDYSTDTLEESLTNPGAFDDVVTINLSGGSHTKTFTGTIGQPIPGTSVTGLPNGVTGNIIKRSSTTAEFALEGVIETPITSDTVTLGFTAKSFTAGYCNCPGAAIQGITQIINLVTV